MRNANVIVLHSSFVRRSQHNSKFLAIMVNEGSAGFNDDEDLIVVAVDEPTERHVVRAFSSNA